MGCNLANLMPMILLPQTDGSFVLSKKAMICEVTAQKIP